MSPAPINALFIAADPAAARRLAETGVGGKESLLLAWSFQTAEAATAGSALAGADVIVVDLPAGDAEMVPGLAQHAPVVALGDPAQLAPALERGAQAALARPELEPRVLALTVIRAAETRRTLAALAADGQAGEARFRNIIERNADGILVIDDEGRVRFVNPAAEALLGRPAAALLGAPFGFPVVSGERTEVDVRRPTGQAAVAEMRVVETLWDGRPARLASLRDITERKQTEAAEREQRILAEALRDSAAALASTLELDDVLDRILANVGRVAPHDTAGIMLLESPGVARVVRSRGYRPLDAGAPADQLRRIDDWSGLRQMAATRRPLVVADTAATPDWVGGVTTAWVRSYAGAPLCLKGEVVGFINLNSAAPHFFGPVHAERLQAFADQAALAIENARLYAARRQAAEEIAALYRASGLLLGPPADLSGLARRITHAVVQEFAPVACSVLLLDEAGTALHLLAHEGPLAMAAAAWPMNGPSLAAAAARAGELIYVPDAAAEPRLGGDPRARTALIAPLHASGRVLGVIQLQSAEPGAFAERARRIVSAFVERAGLAFENARLFREAVRAGERRAALYWATQAISASLDREQLCVAIHQAAVQIVATDTLALALLTEDRAELEEVYRVEHGRRVIGLRHPLAHGVNGHVIATGQSVRSGHFPSSGPQAEGPGPRPPVLRSILAVPLRTGERILGLLAVQSDAANAYSADDQMLLEMLAAHAAVVFENTRLFENAQRLANLDSLTKLYNRRHFFELGQREFERALRYRSSLTLLIADVDHFKRVNDTRGHLAGDQVLRAIAARCREILRDVDIVARYGGEEFVVLMPETGVNEARPAVDRLRQHIAQTPVETDRGPVTVTLSIGAAEMELGYDVNLETLLERADQALYAAKQAGRNSLVVWDNHLPYRSQYGPLPA